MKAVVIYLPEVPHTVQASKVAVDTAKQFGLDVELFVGYTPTRADAYIKQEKLKMYDPGPKLFRIKTKKAVYEVV